MRVSIGAALLAALGLSLAAGVPRSVACAPPDRPRLAEIFYDAVGDDGGFEFVELHHSGSAPWSLAGLRLEAGDGSAPGRWTLRWTGGPGHVIAPGARFVIGGARVAEADAVVTLDLQNGPDAVRLVWPDGAREVVGYGAHEFAEYACGDPAADAPSGSALARIPDTAATGSNAGDFRVARPTPGRANQVDRDAAVAVGTLELDPGHPEPWAPVRARFAIVAAGAQPLPPGVLVAAAWLDDRLLGSAAVEPAVAVGETVWVEIAAESGAEGARTLRAVALAAGDEEPANDADSLRVRVGPGPLEPTEIQFHPERGEGEWIEVRNRTGETLALVAFLFADRGAAGAPLRDSTARLGPGALGIVAQDRDALLAAHPGLDSARVWEARSWAALNNSDGADGFADVVTIRERDGTPCARVPYRASGVPAGVPVELGPHGLWGASLDPRGTPLAPPRELPALASSFELAPRRIAAGAAVRLAWSLPWPRATLAVEVFDLDGDQVASGLRDLEAVGRGEIDWTAPALAPGLYVIALTARAPDGASVTASRALRVVAP